MMMMVVGILILGKMGGWVGVGSQGLLGARTKEQGLNAWMGMAWYGMA